MHFSQLIFNRKQKVLLYIFFFFICILFYYDTIYLEFLAEDYVRIVKHNQDFKNGLFEPLKTPENFSPRFRPIQFYSLGLLYELFGNRVYLYRLLTLILLSLSAYLIFKFFTLDLNIDFYPALSCTIFSIFHFSYADIIYYYCTQQIFLFGLILFIILLRRLYKRDIFKSFHLFYTVILFCFALLTLRSTVVFIGLSIYIFFQYFRRNKISLKHYIIYSGALLLPLFLVQTLDSLHSSFPPVFKTSFFQTSKNVIVLTSHLLHIFKPFGFTVFWNSGEFSFVNLLSFFVSNPASFVMIAIAFIFISFMLYIFYIGDKNLRFLCLGLLLNILLFSRYGPGTSLRYLNLAVIFLLGIASYIYSSYLNRTNYTPAYIGVLIFILVFLYNIIIINEKKPMYLKEIYTIKRVKERLIAGDHIYDEQLYKVKLMHIPHDRYRQFISDLKYFWKIK